MKRVCLSFFLVLFFAAAWFGRYESVELSAVHPEVIQVEVKGEVEKPGLVTVKYEALLQDAIQAAGGVTEQAELSALSLLKILQDGDVVVIPAKKEDQNPVSINTADLEELCTLPGIGPVIAWRIIEYRNEQAFQNLEDIMEVKGVGEKMFEKIREKICL